MRKTTDITINENGNNLLFRIKQMSATQSESWTLRLLMLLAQGAGKGVDDLQSADFSTVVGMLGNVPFEKVQALMDDLLACCSIVKDGIEVNLTRDNVDGFIEERNTLLKLKIEAFKFNNFFQMSGLVGSEASPEAIIKRRG